MALFQHTTRRNSNAERRGWPHFVLAIVVAVIAVNVHADVLDIHTVPTTPVATQSFQLVIESDACDHVAHYDPLNRTINQNGSTLTVTVEYTLPQFPPDGSCIGQVATWAWTLDPLAAGSYTVALRGVEQSGEFFSDLAQLPVVVSPFASATPSAIPVTNVFMLTLAALGMILLALLRRSH